MKRRSFGAISISLIYFVFGFLWIFFSDRILFNLIQDDILYAEIQTWKGWIYVLITTLLIYSLLQTYISGKNKAIVKLTEKETQLQKTILEKEILINELHHRVKNNLQMVSSLINLNKEYHERDLRNLIDKVEEQLFALSSLHERIYLDGQNSYISIKEYILDLTNALRHKHKNQIEIKIKLEIATLMIPVDTAVPIGIVINEALSIFILNYLAGRCRQGIEVEFIQNNNRYSLLIKSLDRESEFNPEENTLSLNLIRILSEQLGAKLELHTAGDCRIALDIPADGRKS